jgi:membrane associated rhomboid family serine protease
MPFLGRTERSFEIPHVTVLLFVTNVAVFGLCTMQSTGANIPVDVLFRYGAMYSQAIERHEYWRLIAHGFLHANAIHIFGNMLCLVLWGGPLEKRVGSLYFTLIYVSGLVAGAIVSNVTHPGAYISVGASGAISAVLGALLSLRLLGLVDLSWSFFAINIGLNVALAASSPRIDWGAHLGGFVAGMVACAILDLLEKALPWLLRCKFPEFAKMNAFVVFAIVAVYYWADPMVGSSRRGETLLMLAAALVVLAIVKLLDLALSMKKGLAIVVVAFALANAALILLWREVLALALAAACARHGGAGSNAIEVVVARACADAGFTVKVAAVGVLALTMLVCWPPFARGLSDVGFVGAALRGERNRRRGI